jgi:hypothetical protein
MGDADDASGQQDNIQLLGAVLILLVIILLHCQSKKRPQRSYMRSPGGYAGGPVHGAPRALEGMTVKQRASNPDLSFSKDREGMNDREAAGWALGRHPASVAQARSNITGMRWASEVFTPGSSIPDPKSTGLTSDRDFLADEYRASRMAQEITGDEVLTPLKPGQRIQSRSTGGDILQLTDYRPQYRETQARVTG